MRLMSITTIVFTMFLLSVGVGYSYDRWSAFTRAPATKDYASLGWGGTGP
jgi:hypothetical protein